MTYGALNEPADIPPELNRWNWGAFFLTWIWGIGNSVWIALLMFVPLVNLVMIFVLGARGSRWAWENRAWRDAAHFRQVQRRWAIAGLISWIAIFGLVGAAFHFGFSAMRNSEAYALTVNTAVANPAVAEALGDDITPSYFFNGSIQIVNSSGTAEFAVPLSGSKGSGTAYSQLVREGGTWQVRALRFTVDGGETIDVIEGGSASSTGLST